MLIKTSGDLQMLFVAVTHLAEGPSLNTLLALNVGKSLICLVGTWRPTVSVTNQQLILFLKRLIRHQVIVAWKKAL
jgi:hypothetical protein